MLILVWVPRLYPRVQLRILLLSTQTALAPIVLNGVTTKLVQKAASSLSSLLPSYYAEFFSCPGFRTYSPRRVNIEC